MKLKNLSMAVHGKDYLQHRITYVNENGTQCRETLCSGVEFAQHVIDCLDAVPSLINERNALRESHSMIATALQIDSTKPSDIMKAVDTLRKERDERYAPDATQSQLSEIRYVLHGDIQPCSVLYSDETTTLLRLDEGDITCETDTIEWSDSLTYRCQELLKSAADPVHIAVPLKTSKLFAQLVRDERILLNDNGNDENPNAETIEAMGEVFVEALSPVGKGQAMKVKPDTSDIPFMCHSPVQEC